MTTMDAFSRPLLFTGLGWPVPTFLLRRLALLSELGLPMIVALDRRGNQSPLAFKAHFVRETEVVEGLRKILITLGTKPRRFLRLLNADPHPLQRKLRFLARNAYLLAIPPPSLIHQQWIGAAEPWWYVARGFKTPLVASARGSQVTLRTHDPTYAEQIRRCLRLPDAVHCVSESIRKRCQELAAPGERLFVNYNGIDTRQFRPQEVASNATTSSSEFRLITVGALIPRKNLMAQLTIVAMLLARGVDARLDIIGAGPDEMVLRHAAAAMGLAEVVSFAGAQSEEEVAARLGGMDVFLSTSVAEGLANCVLEATACGLPVVVFECEGMHEVVRDGETGYVVKAGDVNGFVDCLAWLARNPSLRRALGMAGRKLACSRFEGRACAREMVDQYRAIVVKRGRAREQRGVH